MKYPKTYIDEIKNRLKVSDVVGSKIGLKKRGKEFIGLSPFKKEKTPSFTVSDEKGFYHCFSTGEHGNIFDFIMKTENLNFGEAVKNLALRAGMPVYKFSKEDEKLESSFQKNKNIFKIFFEECNNTLNQKYQNSHLNYLIKNRNLNAETIKFFEIGFCENSTELENKLIQSGFSMEDLINSGLYYKNDKNQKLIPRFFNRIVFPIKDEYGSYVGCGGRSTSEDNFAKYINTPETLFYKKGNNLFNFNHAKKQVGETEDLIIVEGYMDAISLYDKGIKNVCATLGTAITNNQIRLAWKKFKNILICFDNDQSGQEAAYRAAERALIAIEPGLDVFFIDLGKEKDPDEFIKKFGLTSFQSIINNKKNIIEFIFEYHLSKLKNFEPSQVSLMEKNLFKLCEAIQNPISQKYFKNAFKNIIFTKIIKNKNKKNISDIKEIKKASHRLLFNKQEICEFSFLNLLISYPNFSEDRVEEISNIKFKTEQANQYKDELIKLFLNNHSNSKEFIKKIELINPTMLQKIKDISNNSIIISKLNKEDFDVFFDDYIKEIFKFNEETKITSLEEGVLKSLDENLYKQLVSLKNKGNL